MENSGATIKFEKFLESIGGLENGQYTDRAPIKNRYFLAIDDGWLQIVEDLIGELLDDGWDKQVCQIKEKFGFLRFYTNGGSDNHYDIISKYEILSGTICEKCGEPGEIRKDVWWKTLCNKHEKERITKD